MGVFRDRSTLIAALLLAALALGGVAAGGHSHGGLAISAGHEDLPTFSGGHEQPDRTAHVESATRIESASCAACLQQRERASGTSTPVLVGFEPDSSSLGARSADRLGAGACQLHPARAPPRA